MRIFKRKTSFSELFGLFLAAKARRHKPSTIMAYNSVLFQGDEYFSEKDVGKFTEDDLIDFHGWLKGRTPSPVTADSYLNKVCSVFRWGSRNGFLRNDITVNIAVGPLVNKLREYEVSQEVFARVMAACKNQDERTLLALCRIGGLRNPSESLTLRWGCVDFERGRMEVVSPKTERYAAHRSRVIPLFPGLSEELKSQFEKRSIGAELVLDRWSRGPIRRGIQ